MIEVGQMITAVDDKSAKRIGEFREARLQKKKFQGFELSKQRKSARSFVKKVRALLLVYKISYFQRRFYVRPTTSLIISPPYNPPHNSYLSPTNT